jgi:hypothetical protein
LITLSRATDPYTNDGFVYIASPTLMLVLTAAHCTLAAMLSGVELQPECSTEQRKGLGHALIVCVTCEQHHGVDD